MTPRLEKIKKLIELIELSDTDLSLAKLGNDYRALYQIVQKRNRLHQKLRKQMAKYLEETNDA